MSTINYDRLIQIQHDMETTTKALTILDSVSAGFFLLQTWKLKLAISLNHTQNVLNRTINILNHHSIAIEHLGIFSRYPDNLLSTSLHSIESYFLHFPISHILANRLNLNFIHHHDLNNVAQYIATATNVNFITETTASPLIALISNLLIQQTIHFLPRPTSNDTGESILGTLSISSFFAATKRSLMPFSVYQLFSIPHFIFMANVSVWQTYQKQLQSIRKTAILLNGRIQNF